MTVTRLCPECNAEMPPDSPEGLCPRCLLQHGLSSLTPVSSEQGDTGPTPGFFSPPTPTTLAAHFPQLEILELLGHGGMGAVYKARQVKLDRLVAVKILPPEWGKDPAFAERFLREAKALARMSHPHIVAVHDFGEAGGLFFLVMEFVDGANLRQVLHKGKLAPEQALKIIPQICDALQYAHEEGIVHRDIKPENILLDRKGRVKIADFGLAKLINRPRATFTLTASHQIVGTLDYMAPEQRLRPLEVDHRADIYSLGVVIYEMLTGELPLGRFAPPSHMAAVDHRIDEVVFRALAKEPGQRYQQISEVQIDLQAVASGNPPLAVATAAPQPVQPSVESPLFSVPIKLIGDWGFEYPGLLRLEGDRLTIEYEESGFSGTHVKEKQIALSELQSFTLEPGWLATVLVLQTYRLSGVGGIPGGGHGKLYLYVSGKDAELAELLVTRVGKNPVAGLSGTHKNESKITGAPPLDPGAVRIQLRKPAIGLILVAMVIFAEILILASVTKSWRADWPLTPIVCMAGILAIALLLFGTHKMVTLQSRGWAIGAILLAMLPFSYHCLIGIPIGIWAASILNRPQVRAAFAMKFTGRESLVGSAPPPPPPPPSAPSAPSAVVEVPTTDHYPVRQKAWSFWRSFRTMFFSSPNRDDS